MARATQHSWPAGAAERERGDIHDQVRGAAQAPWPARPAGRHSSTSNCALVTHLASCRYLDSATNVLLTGPPGTGKTHRRMVDAAAAQGPHGLGDVRPLQRP
ncbi:MAG: ATP-binding protein [Pseudonocardia sp.]|nr:ATP-binding protein [Pseudonocardia sp.]